MAFDTFGKFSEHREISGIKEKRINPLLQLFPTSSEFKSELGYETAVPQSPLENYSGSKRIAFV
mgnify:CR=1 FL=1